MIIKGRAKIIRKQNDYYSLKDNAIIVAKRTAPDITIVINRVVGIITEAEGILSHAAIIAREYDKPLIMGVKNATKKYKDGQIIRINLRSKTIC